MLVFEYRPFNKCLIIVNKDGQLCLVVSSQAPEPVVDGNYTISNILGYVSGLYGCVIKVRRL